jgi:molecular chaperone DnaK (HSP70)
MPQASIALQPLVPLSRVSPSLQLQPFEATAIGASLSGLGANDTVASAILANSSPRSFPSNFSTSMDSMMAHQQLTPHNRLPFGLSSSSLPSSAQHSICIQQFQQQYVQRQEELRQQRQQLEHVLEQLQRQQP